MGYNPEILTYNSITNPNNADQIKTKLFVT